MKIQNIIYLLFYGISLMVTPLAHTQSSASHSVKIIILRPNEMRIENNTSQNYFNITQNTAYNFNWKSHDKGLKITIVRKNLSTVNKLKMITRNEMNKMIAMKSQ